MYTPTLYIHIMTANHNISLKKGDGVEIRITVGLIKPEDIRYLPSYLWQSVNVKKKHPRLGLNIW